MVDKPLTDEIVAKAQSRTVPYALTDADGLYLWVTPTAGKLWRWEYTFDGHRKIMSYGEWPRLDVARAKAEHSNAQRRLAQGVDPITWKRVSRERSKYLKVARRRAKILIQQGLLPSRRSRLPASEDARLLHIA